MSKLLFASSSANISSPYQLNSNVSAFTITAQNTDVKIESFASALCVGNANVTAGTRVNMAEASAAALYDVNKTNIIYSKNLHRK